MTEGVEGTQGTEGVAEQSMGNLADAAGVQTKEVEKPPEGAEGTQAKPKWYVAPDVEGQGDKPEWHDNKNYKSIYDEAKSASEMRKKLGAFSGAPDEYSLELGDDYKGVELDTEDPLLKDFTNYAKKSKMSQEAYTDNIKMFVSYNQLQEQRQEKELGEFQSMELEKLGGAEKAKQKIDEMCQWFGQNFPSCNGEDFKDMMYFADAFNIFRVMRDKMGYAKVPSSDTQNVDLTSPHELAAMVNNKKYLSDPRYQKMVNEKYQAHYGK